MVKFVFCLFGFAVIGLNFMEGRQKKSSTLTQLNCDEVKVNIRLGKIMTEPQM